MVVLFFVSDLLLLLVFEFGFYKLKQWILYIFTDYGNPY